MDSSLEIKWSLVLDQETRIYLNSASEGEIDSILETIAEAIKEGISCGSFWIDKE